MPARTHSYSHEGPPHRPNGRRDHRPGGSGILAQRAAGHVMTGSVTSLRTQALRPLRSPLALPAGASRRTLSPPGVIGGAVVCSARRSVRIARHQFARSIGMDHATTRDLELGEIPLFCVPYDLLRQIAAIARDLSAGGLGPELAEFGLALALLATGDQPSGAKP